MSLKLESNLKIFEYLLLVLKVMDDLDSLFLKLTSDGSSNFSTRTTWERIFIDEAVVFLEGSDCTALRLNQLTKAHISLTF